MMNSYSGKATIKVNIPGDNNYLKVGNIIINRNKLCQRQITSTVNKARQIFIHDNKFSTFKKIPSAL